MSEINFIPKSYLQAQKRQARLLREAVVVLLAGALLVGWYLYELAQTQVLAQLVVQTQDDAKKVQDQIANYQNLQLERQAMLKQLRVHRELTQPLTHTAILATIGQIMPASIGLTDMTVVATAPTPVKPVVQEKRRSSRVPASGDKDKKADDLLKMPALKPLRIELVGVAPNDVEIADFMARLSDHVLFTDVKMLFSRPVETQDLIAREFRIDMQVPLDREYRAPEPESESETAVESTAVEKGEVAHAD